MKKLGEINKIDYTKQLKKLKSDKLRLKHDLTKIFFSSPLAQLIIKQSPTNSEEIEHRLNCV